MGFLRFKEKEQPNYALARISSCWDAGRGHCTLTALLNTFIHSLMYFYYFVAALGPSFKKYLWWKKYLTVMQMVEIYPIMAVVSIHETTNVDNCLIISNNVTKQIRLVTVLRKNNLSIFHGNKTESNEI
uniref:Elongation of very long chain fatty acids protein n=1 Tax=Timema shepardi TaxID=629360 RepID=A0A7R9B0M0_TIMSH|nr:unnamed protein product [Timema shepardi]